MAWFNPNKISFNPNSQVIEQSGAIGNKLQEMADNKFQQQLAERKASMLADQFNFQKQQAGVQNQHWQDNFAQTKQQSSINNAYKDTQMGLNADKLISDTKHRTQQQANQAEENKRTADYRSDVLLRQDNVNNLNKKKYEDKQSLDTEKNRAIGEYWAGIDPSIAKMFGYDTQQPTSVFNDPANIGYAGDAIKSQKKITTKDPLSKEKAKYNELIKTGGVTVPFGKWLEKTGGSLKLKSESITKARNTATEQTSALDNYVEQLIGAYNKDSHGVWDGTLQSIQEMLPILQTGDSARLESGRNANTMNMARVLNGGKPSDKDFKIAETIVGGAVSTEAGKAEKLKAGLEMGIKNINRTIQQIKTAGGDVAELETKINQYKETLEKLKDWDGSFTPNLSKKTNSSITPIFNNAQQKDYSKMSTQELIESYKRGER